MTIDQEIADAEAKLAQLKRKAAHATCREIGSHDWKHIGNKNACCSGDDHCGCSTPVYECSRCGDCDYGDNAERDAAIIECARMKE